MAKKPPKQASGGSRLIASGKKPVLLGVPKGEHARVTRAAKRKGVPLTQYVWQHALAAADADLSGN